MPTPRPTKGRGVRPQYTVKVKDKKSSLATVALPTEIIMVPAPKLLCNNHDVPIVQLIFAKYDHDMNTLM